MHAAPLAQAPGIASAPMRTAGHYSTDRTDARPRGHRLEPGRALRLTARQDGELRVTEGRLWITFDPPLRGRGAAVRTGDHFVAAGEGIALCAHDRIVLESHGRHRPAGFDWLPASAQDSTARQALADLRAAAALAADALRRLLLPGFAQRPKCS